MKKPTATGRRSFLQSCATSMLAPAMAAQEPPEAVGQLPAQSSLATIPRSEQFTLASAKGTRYRIQVAKPAPINPDLPLMVRGAKPIPIYVLDADLNFGAVTNMSRLMQFGGELPPTVIVGIAYEDEATAERLDYRRGDLTPTKHSG